MTGLPQPCSSLARSGSFWMPPSASRPDHGCAQLNNTNAGLTNVWLSADAPELCQFEKLAGSSTTPAVAD
jgi:hypothetical protein